MFLSTKTIDYKVYLEIFLNFLNKWKISCLLTANMSAFTNTSSYKSFIYYLLNIYVIMNKIKAYSGILSFTVGCSIALVR